MQSIAKLKKENLAIYAKVQGTNSQRMATLAMLSGALFGHILFETL